MATHKSKQTKQWEALGHGPLKPNELHGRVRIAYFQFKADRDSDTLTVDQNDTIRLCQLPAGARLIGGTVKTGALGALVTADFGLAAYDGSGKLDKALLVADDPDAIATNVDVSAAITFNLFEESAYLFYETEKELDLTLLLEGADPADNVEISGTVLYVVD